MADAGRLIPAALLSPAVRPPAELELAAYRVDLRGKRVADIGAGEGRLALGAAGDAASVIAVDPDSAALRRGREAAKRAGVRNVSFRQGAAQALRLPGESFDVVIFSWTL